MYEVAYSLCPSLLFPCTLGLLLLPFYCGVVGVPVHHGVFPTWLAHRHRQKLKFPEDDVKLPIPGGTRAHCLTSYTAAPVATCPQELPQGSQGIAAHGPLLEPRQRVRQLLQTRQENIL